MIDRRHPDERLWCEALEHVLAVRSARAEPDAVAAAERWRMISPAHDEVYREAEEVWKVAGAMPAQHAGRWFGVRARGIGRRRLLVSAGAMAAGIAALAVLPDVLHLMQDGERTSTGEVRHLQLSDGSRVMIGPDSMLHAAVDGRGRHVELVAGMAYFDVAADPTRPFVVTSGDLTARVLGTAFEVQNRAGRLSIAVTHGRVEVSSAAPPMLSGERLGAGDWLAIDREERVIERGQSAAERVASWRDRMIVVERRPVRAVIEEIAPWYAGRIVLMDAALGDRLVSGVYDLRDPAAALEAAVGPFGGRVRRITPWLLFISSGA